MISQVEDEPMISNAYNTGVLFFYKKNQLIQLKLSMLLKYIS